MMNSMHARRDEGQVQNPFDLNWQTPVGMMKKCRCLKAAEEHDQHQRTDTEDHHGEREKAGGKNHFAEVKSRGRAHIEIQVGVMHIMKSPEKRNHMQGPVPPPISVIHQKKG